MCKVGDIILIDKYKHGTNILSHHSFIVISDEGGKIEGLNYDIICNVLSSFKDDKQKERKLSYDGNFPVANDDTVTNPDNGLNGYVKTDQLYYFNKEKIDFKVIGYINPEILELIIEFVNTSDFKIYAMTDNL